MIIYDHKLYKSIAPYSKDSYFLQMIIDFIINDKKLHNYLSFISSNTSLSSKQIAKFLNSRKIRINKKYKCKKWDDFINKYNFKKSHELFFHDIVGHIILKNNVTSKGEILATAGMSGFSFELGKFFFVNAILIYSLGYRLFDDTKSDYSDISKYIDDINIAYENGLKLRKFLKFNENILNNNLSIEEYLLKNCDRIEGFKIE